MTKIALGGEIMIFVALVVILLLAVGLIAGIRHRQWWLVVLTSVVLVVIVGYAIAGFIVFDVLDK